MTAQLSRERIMKICNDVFWMFFGVILFFIVNKVLENAGLLSEACK